MKNHYAMLLLLAAFCYSSVLFGQERTALLEESGKIVLPEGQSLSETYLIDVPLDGFNSREEMLSFFLEKSTPQVNFRALTERNQVVVILNRKDMADWTREDWNAHLAEHANLKELTKSYQTK